MRERLPSASYLRFDYSGHGLSSGTFTGTSLRDWFADALAVFDELTHPAEPQILVGESPATKNH